MKPGSAIAVGSAGSAPGYCAVAALFQSFGSRGLRILACDTNPAHLVAAASIASDFVRLPSASSAGFASTAADILYAKGVLAFVPIHDEEIRISTRERSTFEARGITVCAGDATAINLSTDKLLMTKRVSDAGLTAPETRLLRSDLSDLGFPLVIKPRKGVGSHGMTQIDGPAELQREMMLRGSESDFVAQQWLAPPEVTVDAFVAPRSGLTVAICRERIEMKAGISTKARLFHGPEYDRMASRLAASLGLEGSFCFQFRSDPAQLSPSIIDVNPRIGGATAMSVAVGVDFPSAHVAHFLGEDPAPFIHRAGGEFYVTRSFREHVMAAPAS